MKPRKPKYGPDYTRIYGVPKITGPRSGLTMVGNVFKVVYYQQNGKSSAMTIGQMPLAEAQKVRDELYEKARKCGRGHRSKLAMYASEILKNPEIETGIHYAVYFGRRSKTFRTLKQARAWRAEIAKTILATEATK